LIYLQWSFLICGRGEKSIFTVMDKNEYDEQLSRRKWYEVTNPYDLLDFDFGS